MSLQSIQAMICDRKKCKSTKDRYQLTKSIADAYFSIGKFEAASEEYKCLLDYLNNNNFDLGPNENRNESLMFAQRCIADCFIELEKYDDAIVYANLYQKKAISLSNVIHLQRATITLGRAHIYRGKTDDEKVKNLKEAEKLFSKALEICSKGKIKSTEIKEMVANNVFNRGITCEQLGLYKEATSDYLKSIKLYNLPDNLEMILIVTVALCNLLLKRGNYGEVVEHVDNILKECGHIVSFHPSHSTLAKIHEVVAGRALAFVGLLQFDKAAQHFKCLYENGLKKRNFPNPYEYKKMACKALTCGRLISELEQATDPNEKQQIHDVLGDIFVDLHLFTAAVQHYEMRLVLLTDHPLSSEKEQFSATCATLYSIATTCHNDLRSRVDLLKALQHYRMEAKLREDMSELNQAYATYKLMRNAIHWLLSVVKSSSDITFGEQLLREVEAAISRLVRIQPSLLDLPEDGTQLSTTDNTCNDQQIDEEEEKSSEDVNDIPDIEMEEIFDGISGDKELKSYNWFKAHSDVESEMIVTVPRSARTKTLKKWTKNEKGESPLHVACINGDFKVVQNYLDQGHPVDDRDNTGWQAIHEAANYGHVAIIKLLLENGANLEDGGPPDIESTPLLEAANGGHADVILFLLKSGANLWHKNKNGENLGDLWDETRRRCEKNGEFNKKALEAYNEVVNTIKAMLGDSYNAWLRDGKRYSECEAEPVSKKTRLSLPTTQQRNLRDVNVTQNDEEEDDDAVSDYRRAIKSLGSSKERVQVKSGGGQFGLKKPIVLDSNSESDNESGTCQKKPKSSPNLENDSQVLLTDDWLIDDIGDRRQSKKVSEPHYGSASKPSSSRPSNRGRKFPERVSLRGAAPSPHHQQLQQIGRGIVKTPTPSVKSSKLSKGSLSVGAFSEDNFACSTQIGSIHPPPLFIPESPPMNRAWPNFENNALSKLENTKALTLQTESPSSLSKKTRTSPLQINETLLPSASVKVNLPITNNTPPTVAASSPASLTRAAVSICGRTIMVPIIDPKNTVDWLIKQAENRVKYFCSSSDLGDRPLLLETVDGVLLAPCDRLCDVLPAEMGVLHTLRARPRDF